LTDAELAAILAAPTLHDTWAGRIVLVAYFDQLEFAPSVGMTVWPLGLFIQLQEIYWWKKSHPGGGEGC
jgi:hypothetical protein